MANNKHEVMSSYASKGDVIVTIPFGVVVVQQRKRAVDDKIFYRIRTKSDSRFAVNHELVKRLATREEAKSFRSCFTGEPEAVNIPGK